MLVCYLHLGLEPGATDEQIRQRYLELVRRHPPTRDAQRFQQVADAYEALRDERARVRGALFATARLADPEQALRDLVGAARRRAQVRTLQDLLREEGLDG